MNYTFKKTIRKATNLAMVSSILIPLASNSFAAPWRDTSNDAPEVNTVTTDNPYINFIGKAKEGQPIPEKNNLIIQKLEYKYNRLDRTSEVVEDKNKSGHDEVRDDIKTSKSAIGQHPEKNTEKYTENPSHKRYRDENNINLPQATKNGEFPDFYDKDTVADERDSRLGELDSTDRPGIQNTGEPISPDVLRSEYQVKAYSPKLYGEVEFSLFKLDTSESTLQALIPKDADYTVNGDATQNKAFSQAMQKAVNKVGGEIEEAFKSNSALPYGARLIATQSVDEDGATTFRDVKTYDLDGENKKSNLYIIVETKHPDTVVGKASPMFVYLPMVDPNGEYKDNVYLYPKNEVKENTFPFEKHKDDIDGSLETDDGPLQGAKFKIYKGDPADHENNRPIQKNGQDYIVTTNERGQVDITGNVRGVYYLVEQEVADLIDGVTTDAQKYVKRDGFKYLAGYDALNNPYNVLVYNVGPDGKARTGAVIGEGRELSKTNILEFTNHAIPDFEKIINSDRTLQQGWNFFEDIPFEVSQTIPDNIYQYSKFEFKDQLEKKGDDNTISDGVQPTDEAEFVKGTDGHIAFEVVNDRGEQLERGTDYFVTVEEDNKFEITLANPEKANLTAREVTPENNRFTEKVRHSKSITVKYKAQIKANGEPDVLYNNKAEFTYNNGPEVGLTKDRYNHDGKKFKTFGKKFQKFDKGLFGTSVGKQTLEGAEFIIKDAQGNYFNGYRHNENAQGGVEPFFTSYKSNKEAYEALRRSEAHKDAIIVSGTQGKFEVRGLKAGTYTLVEMKAPHGFRQDNLPEIQFTVGENTYTESGNHPQDIQNERNPELPFTGSEKLVLTAGAAILVIGTATGAAFYVLNRKKKQEQEEVKNA